MHVPQHRRASGQRRRPCSCAAHRRRRIELARPTAARSRRGSRAGPARLGLALGVPLSADGDDLLMTVYSPGLKYYASGPLQGDLQTLLQQTEARYDVHLPLADLFWFGTAQAPASSVLAASVVGPARVGGQATTQYAFRQAGVDWRGVDRRWRQATAAPLRHHRHHRRRAPAVHGRPRNGTWRRRFPHKHSAYKPGSGDHRITLVAVEAAEVQP